MGLLLTCPIVLQENLKSFYFEILPLQGNADVVSAGLQSLLDGRVFGGHHHSDPFPADDDIKIDAPKIRRVEQDPYPSEIVTRALSRFDDLVDDGLHIDPCRAGRRGGAGLLRGDDIGHLHTEREHIAFGELCLVIGICISALLMITGRTRSLRHGVSYEEGLLR